MHSLIEIHIGPKIIGNINCYGKFPSNFRKLPPDTKFPENLQLYPHSLTTLCHIKLNSFTIIVIIIIIIQENRDACLSM